jgi:purine-binding chemotaxis protein CheW
LALVSEKENIIQLISFRAGGKLFGVNILSIREILRNASLESIQDAPPFVAGGIGIRGTMIPAIDLKKRLGNPQQPNDTPDRCWALISHIGSGDVGFLVDSVMRILKVEPDAILPAPDIILSGLRSPYIQGVCNSEVGTLVVLDLSRMLAADEMKALKKVMVPHPT